jgi:FAD/FMN-containing dehydrogenase
VAVPAGSCPTVGIAGLALGGGFGLSSRSLGLTCDSLVGAEVVTAEGDVLEVTEREQPDLFWALRGGGGGSFGVVTRFDFSAHVVSDVTLYHVRWPWAQAAEAIAAWQAWAPTVDDRMVSLLLVPAAPSQYVYSAGQFAGTPDEMQRYLVPLLASGTPIAPTFDVMSFLDAARTFAGLMPTPHMGNLDGIPPPQKFKNTSCFGYSDLPSEGIAALLAQLESAPGPANLVQFDALGGAISRLAPDATAFCHRLARWNLQLQSYWSDPDDEAANRRWIDETRAALAPFTRGAYVNYADADLPDWAQAYFGDNLPRLQHVKAAYDPDDVFHFAQSIPLAK